MSRYGRQQNDIEPCTISNRDIADVLERQGRPRMAAMVRDHQAAIDRLALLEEQARRDLREALARLEKYEPTPQRTEPVNNWTGD